MQQIEGIHAFPCIKFPNDLRVCVEIVLCQPNWGHNAENAAYVTLGEQNI